MSLTSGLLASMGFSKLLNLCSVCNQGGARWRCMTCKTDPVSLCRSLICLEAHEKICLPKPDPTTTVGILEIALKNEPFMSCSCPRAADRCRGCLEHDDLRTKIEAALEAARKLRKS